MKAKTRNTLLVVAGAFAAACIIDEKIKPLGISKINPLAWWRLRNVKATEQALLARASAPNMGPMPASAIKTSTSAAAINQASLVSRYGM